MEKDQLEKIIELCKSEPKIKLGYFFGSRATETSGPMSDHDFAFYLEENDPRKSFDIRLTLIAEISQIIKTDKVDVVILNNVKNPTLGYNIITTGKLFYEIEPYKVVAEPKILNKYFDFKMSLKYNYLAKAKQ